MFKVGVVSNAGAVARAFASAANAAMNVTEVALNHAVEIAHEALPAEIKKAGYGFRPGDVRKALRIERASGGRLVARVMATGRPIALIHFDARQSGSGVTVNVLNGRKGIPGAFIARMPTGHEGVYVRDPRTRRVRELYGPSVPNGLANPKVQAALKSLLRDRFPRLLQARLIKPSASR